MSGPTRPAPPSTERRRSQIFSPFSLAARLGRTQRSLPSSPATGSSPQSHTRAFRQTDADVLLKNLASVLHDPPRRTAALQPLLFVVRTTILDASQIVAIYEACLQMNQSYEVDLTEVACTLLGALLSNQDVPQSLRVDWVNSSTRDSQPSILLNTPQLLTNATDHGRNIDGLEQSILVSVAMTAFQCLQLRLQHEKADSTDNEREKTNAAFERALQLLRSTVRLGSSIDTKHHPIVITEVRRMIELTNTSTGLMRLLEVLDAFVSRGELPEGNLVPVVQSLCALYAKSSHLRQARVLDKAKETLEWLFKTHVKDRLLEAMVNICDSAFQKRSYDPAQADGALQLLTLILSDEVLCDEAEIDLDKIFALLRYAAFLDRALLKHAAQFLYAFIHKPRLQHTILEEPDWDNFAGAIRNTFEQVKKAGDDIDSATNWDFDLALEELHRIDLSPHQRDQLERTCLGLGKYLPQHLAQQILHDYARPGSIDETFSELIVIITNFLGCDAVTSVVRTTATVLINETILDMQQTEPDMAKEAIKRILDALVNSNMDYPLQSKVTDIIVNYITLVDDSDDDLFDHAVAKLCLAAYPPRHQTPSSSPQPQLRSARPTAIGLVQLFLRSVNHSGYRSQKLIDTFLDLLLWKEVDSYAAVMILRVMFRLRGDINHRIFLAMSAEGEGLAATLSRAKSNMTDNSRRPSKASSLSDAGAVWMYGTSFGLPEDPPASVSTVLSSQQTNLPPGVTSLGVSKWLKFAIDIVEHGGDWEVFSYAIVHLGAQLTNQALYVEAVQEIKDLRSLLCKQLLSDKVYKPDDSTGIKQADVAACLFHVLTMLIGYHDHFSRPETEEMISAFIRGLTAWGARTTVPCIHALTLCCYELPRSLERDLVRIVSQMSTIVTKPGAAVHVLEFLAGLSRLPDLSRNFRGDEIKTVFGVCFSYIDDVRGRLFEEEQRAKGTFLTRISERPISEDHDELPTYVFALAYFVITFWFLTMHDHERHQYFDWIQSRLLKEIGGKREDQALVTLDFAWRLTKRMTSAVSLLSPDMSNPPKASLVNQYSLLTLHVDVAASGAKVRVVDRRPSGIDEWTFDHSSGSTIDLGSGGLHDQSHDDAADLMSAITLGSSAGDPEDLSSAPWLEVLRAQVLDKAVCPFPDADMPVPLEFTDRVSGAVSMFDRVSPVDFFKAGVLYVGEDQTTENAILGNQRGSPDYNLMLSSMGSVLRLCGLRHNTCGLDTSEARRDGEKTIWSRDDVIALIFHVTTLMPNHEHDPQRNIKKQHVGNDYVNVVFNNSGKPYQFDTIPSAFAYVYIVVSPEARSTFIETRTRQNTDDAWFQNSWFKVQVLTKEGFPNIGSASETKVVSGKALGMYVRNLVLNACIFAEVWAVREGGGSAGSWRTRFEQLKAIKKRFGAEPDEVSVESDKARK